MERVCLLTNLRQQDTITVNVPTSTKRQAIAKVMTDAKKNINIALSKAQIRMLLNIFKIPFCTSYIHQDLKSRICYGGDGCYGIFPDLKRLFIASSSKHNDTEANRS